jgi:hypothetical protein
LKHDDDFFVPSPGARLNGRGRIDVLGLRISHSEDGFDVMTVPGVEHPARNLHVLLRHRPRSIALLRQPGGFEGGPGE